MTEIYKIQINYKFRTPGALATITPIAISAAITTGKPIMLPPTNTNNPIANAKIVIILTNLEIYF